MPRASNSADSSFACTLTGCTRVFNSKQGLLVHQRTCLTKQVEREQVAQYEAEMQAERTREAEGMNQNYPLFCFMTYNTLGSVADPPPVRRQRIWEDPLLRKRINTVVPIFMERKSRPLLLLAVAEWAPSSCSNTPANSGQTTSKFYHG